MRNKDNEQLSENLESCLGKCKRADNFLDMKPDRFGMSYEEHLESGDKPHRMCKSCLKFIPKETLNKAHPIITEQIKNCPELMPKEQEIKPEEIKPEETKPETAVKPVGDTKSDEPRCGLYCSFDNVDGYGHDGCLNSRKKRSSYVGTASLKGRWPWQVALRHKIRSKNDYNLREFAHF